MRKKWITIGILCVCLFISAGVLLFLSGPGKETERKEEDAEAALLAAGTSISSLTVENESGGYRAVWKDGGVKIDGLNEALADEEMCGSLSGTLYALKSRKSIPDGRERRKDFGLEDPEVKAEIIMADGSRETVLVGEKVPDAETSGRYVLWKEEVQVVEESGISVLFAGRNDFVEKEITPSYERESESVTVQALELKKAGEEPVRAELLDSQEMAGYVVNSYRLTSPVEYPAKAGITEDIFPSLFGITALEVVAVSPDAKTLESLGLSEPYAEVKVSYRAGESGSQEFTLKAAKPDKEGKVCILREDREVIYRCSAEALSWISADREDFISDVVFSPDLRSLAAICIESEEKTYEIRLNDVGEESEAISCNGKSADGESFRNLYYMLISQSADEVLFGQFPDTEELKKEIEITYRYTDGKEDCITYYKEAPRSLYADLNSGERGFRLKSSGMEKVLENLEKLLNGEEIAAVY